MGNLFRRFINDQAGVTAIARTNSGWSAGPPTRPAPAIQGDPLRLPRTIVRLALERTLKDHA